MSYARPTSRPVARCIMGELYIDNAKRKRIVTFWIPVCLGFLHVWASCLVASAVFSERSRLAEDTVSSMFSSCTWGIGFLILLLISDKAVEFIITKFLGNAPAIVEKTTTETTKVVPAAPVDTKTPEEPALK